VNFDEISDEFLRITGEVVWATVATVDTRGRPRTRMLHPIWEITGGQPVGWIGTSRSPLKTRHLAATPYVSVAYWSPAHETVNADCRAAWADDERERVWRLYAETEPPRGYDPAAVPPFKDGPLGGVWAVLRLDPWRVRVLNAEDFRAGRYYDRYWTSEP
jgi:Pyridoxamine 5'-phosphate oxidase